MKIFALVAVAGLAGTAMADFNTGVFSGPTNSDGGAGNAANGVQGFSYGGPAFFVGSIRIRGTANYGGTGSFLSELRYSIVDTGGTRRDSGQLTTGGTWAGGFAVDNTQASGFVMGAGNYSIRFWESFNDSGVDATWTDYQFDFIAGTPPPPPPCTMIGTYTAGAFDINTFSSAFDTEIGLYDLGGGLLASNDDAGGGLQSQITPTLGAGTYYLAVGGFNSNFAGGFGATGGAANGVYDLNVNGYLAENDQVLAANQIKWYCFEVVPTPGTMSLAGLAGLVALRRRR